jgi:hypothetical protein
LIQTNSKAIYYDRVAMEDTRKKKDRWYNVDEHKRHTTTMKDDIYTPLFLIYICIITALDAPSPS